MNEASVTILETVSGWVQISAPMDNWPVWILKKLFVVYLNVLDPQRACKSHNVLRSVKSAVRPSLFVLSLNSFDSLTSLFVRSLSESCLVRKIFKWIWKICLFPLDNVCMANLYDESLLGHCFQNDSSNLRKSAINLFQELRFTKPQS